jgi:hypothetical protein
VVFSTDPNSVLAMTEAVFILDYFSCCNSRYSYW